MECCSPEGKLSGERTGLNRQPSLVEAGQTTFAYKRGSTYELERTSGTEVDIPEDAYGGAILAIVKEFEEIRNGQNLVLSSVRCFFALGLLVANITLQFLVLSFLGKYVVGPQVRHIQKCYKSFHAEVYDRGGNFIQEKWDTYDGKDDLCQIALTNRTFLYSLLLLWTAAMMVEARTGERLMRAIHNMPLCSASSEMLRDDITGSKICIVALTRGTRWMLYALVCIPKMLICAALLRLGWRWLLATTSFKELIMNTVAMEFVIHIDELLYLFAVPQTYRRLVMEINFFIPEAAKTRHNVDRDEWIGYLRSAIYVAMTFILVVLYVEFVQDLLPPSVDNVHTHCGQFYAKNGPICGSRWLDGRIFVNMDGCFPYGDEDE